jgi:hypothetical protein
MVLGTEARRRRRNQRWERGVSLVEYALGVSLVLVASLTAIGGLQDNAEENLTSHGATAGAPDLPDLGITTAPPTTSTPTTAPPATSPPAAISATATFSNEVIATATGNTWSAKIDVTARDSTTNQPLTGVTITVTWTPTPNDSPITQTCSVPSTGVCTFQRTGMATKGGQFVDTVTLRVDSISSTSQTVNYTSGSASRTFDGPNE